MWSDPNDLAGVGCIDCFLGDMGASVNPAVFAAEQSLLLANQVAVKPTTQDQIFNLINTIAGGILQERLAVQQTKLSSAEAAAAAQQSKVQAQNYVMQQLQQGKAVMVDKTWLDKFSASGGVVQTASTVLIIGGVALLGYAAYRWYAKPKRRARMA
jgi:hypothetical protein